MISGDVSGFSISWLWMCQKQNPADLVMLLILLKLSQEENLIEILWSFSGAEQKVRGCLTFGKYKSFTLCNRKSLKTTQKNIKISTAHRFFELFWDFYLSSVVGRAADLWSEDQKLSSCPACPCVEVSSALNPTLLLMVTGWRHPYRYPI